MFTAWLQVKRSTSFKAHDGKVTCTQLSPSNSTQLFTSSPSDNLLKCWDFNDGKLLESHKLFAEGWKLLRFTVLRSGAFFGLVALNSKYPNVKNDWKVVQLRLQTNHTGDKSATFGRVLLKSKGWKCGGLTSGGLDDKYVAAISNCTLLWFDTKLNESSKRVHSRKLTALAIHPNQECIATGDVEGKIVLWRRNTCSILHWHAHPLTVARFTGDGLYLLSGGPEAVLVIWQLSSSKKTFLPRIGGPISELCVNSDSSKYAVRTEQNIVYSIDAPSLNVDFELNGLAFKSLSNRTHAELLEVDPKTGGVIVPRDGMVHLYSAEDARIIGSVDVCKRNYVSPTEDEKLNTTVVEAATASSTWLATVERRQSEVTLKLWERSVNAEFTLVSVVSRAHLRRVNALQFHPFENALITGSDDCYFKMWKLKSRRGGWFCKSVAFHKMLPIKDCKFSADGSIIAVAESCSVSLWDYKSNALVQRLSAPQLTKGIARIVFCGQYSLAVMMRGHGLHMWDLRRLSISWSLSLPVHSVAARSNTLAVGAKKNIYVFRHDSPVPTSCFELNDIAEYVAYSPKSGRLFYRTRGWNCWTSKESTGVHSTQSGASG